MGLPLPVQQERAATFRALHHDPALLVLVNVWDVASARAVASVPGCTALATASAAVAAAGGYDDGEQVPLDRHLAVVDSVCSAVDLPVSADLERGYGDVAATVEGALAAGAVGCNLEDDLCPVDEMQARIRTAVRTGEEHGVPLVVNARPDVYLLQPDLPEEEKLRESLHRGLLYLDAGADSVFVPGCTDEMSIRSLADAFGPGRLNLLAVAGIPPRVRLEELGVARVSHGPYPYRHAMAALTEYARDHLGT